MVYVTDGGFADLRAATAPGDRGMKIPVGPVCRPCHAILHPTEHLEAPEVGRKKNLYA
jgi:hypothetical protein